MPFFQQAYTSLVHIFYPRLCMGCHQPLPRNLPILCTACDNNISRRQNNPNVENETLLRLSGRFPFSYAFSLSTFSEGSVIQKLLHQLKYKNQEKVGIFLGEKLAASIIDKNWWPTIDGMVPMPLHARKLYQRGYNQSDKIAEGMHAINDLPILNGVLQRTIPTASQTTKSRRERLHNVGDVFQVTHQKSIEGKHLLLLDDVLTTGATIESCARTLLQQGAGQISVGTIAIVAH